MADHFTKDEMARVFELCIFHLNELFYNNDCRMPELSNESLSIQSAARKIAESAGFIDKCSKTEKKLLGLDD